MPMHPDLVKQLQREGRSMPTLVDRYSRGIDRPQHVTTPPTGNFNLLVVAVDFSDKVGMVNTTFFDNLVFNPAGPGVNSVTDYFDEISRSTLTLVTVNLPGSLGWKRAPGNYNGANGYINADGIPSADDYGWGPYPQNLQGIVWDVIPLIDPIVDFSQYDNDGDGFVDSVTFVHAGPGTEITGSPNDIWSSAWNLSDAQGPGPIWTLEGVMVDGFSFEAEYMVTPGDQTIGMFCHELGHSLFGLPDLYDPDGSSYGAGTWSMMALGGWNGPPLIYIPLIGWVTDGSSPAWPDAWSRTVMGFEQPTEVTTNLSYQFIDPAESPSSPMFAVYKLWSPKLGPREYYLVENRQPVGYDSYLPGQGLLIWHVDEDKWNAWEANTYECTNFSLPIPLPGCSCPVWHYLVSLEQADGAFDLEKKSNRGDANDPYPQPYGQSPTIRDFMFGTTPESGSWYASTCASDSCLAVKNISVFLPGPPDLLMADFQVICGSGNSCINILPPPVVWGESGATANHLVGVQNCGPYDLFGLSATSEWPVSFFNPTTGQPITNIAIMAGATAQVGVHVNIPERVGPGQANTLTMTVDPNWMPGPSVTTTLITQVPTCVLLVDDDRKQPDVEPVYLSSLSQNNFSFDYWDVFTWGNPDADTLSAHQSVIWFTGNAMYDTLHIRDEMALADYLDGGGQLFLSSQEYLNDAFRTFFNRSYLGVGMYLNDLGANTVKGVAGTPLWQNLGPFTLLPSASGADRFNPLPGALGAFENENGYYNGLALDSGTWRSLFLAWPFEYLAPPDAEAVMSTAMSWLEILPRPTVSFTASTPIVCTGDVVTFTNTSASGDRWWWDFGDGNTSTMTDTIHTYFFPVSTTVTLKGKNCCGYELASQPIEVLPAPQVSFTASTPIACIGDVVTFTNTSTDVDRWWWDFGDGITSTMTDTTHSYTYPLSATVTLLGKNDCGSETSVGSIEILPASQVSFTVSSGPIRVGDTVVFTSTFANVTHLLWDFGDDITSTLPNPTHIYTMPLTATVTLKGFGDCGVATVQEVLRVDARNAFIYLPLAMKNTQGSQPVRQEDWVLVVVPVTAVLMRLSKKHLR